MNKLVALLESLIFGYRIFFLGIFLLLTIFMAYSATNLRIDAGFTKLIPMQHEYMQAFIDHGKEFGGANKILVALMAEEGDIFTAEFFNTLEKVTDEVFFLPGVDRSKVTSIFTPNVRFTEVTEEGFAGGNVVYAEFQPDKEGLAQVRRNILKSGVVGKLVANNFTGAIISAELIERDPKTGKRLDYLEVAKRLEDIRSKHENKHIKIHVIGFAKFIGDMTDGAKRVLLFFLVAFVVTALMVYFYIQSFRLTVITLVCSLVAVVWQLGLLPLLGFGIDPMSILVPFLVFAIGVSHGLQMVGSTRSEVFIGAQSLDAARSSFRKLLIPGTIALTSDVIGFIAILLIKIQMIQEMAITASLGVGMIILTNLILLPLLMSYIDYSEEYRQKTKKRAARMYGLWARVANVCKPKNATIVLGIALLLLIFGAWKGANIKVGDMEKGVPELRANSRYNVDASVINDNFSISTDVLTVIAATKAEGCIDYAVVSEIDRFAWHMGTVPGVQSVSSLPKRAKIATSGWNEGNLKFRELPRNIQSLVQANRFISTGTGLVNKDCSLMPVKIFTEDHKAETISRIVQEVKDYIEAQPSDLVKYKLATGNVGVMAATNEVVASAQFPILIYVFVAIILLCYLAFRSVPAVLCIVLPLALVSILGYAVMSVLGIGLKVSTLPVVALGVGVGVDYGIYIFSRFQSFLKEGKPLREAYQLTLEITGNGVFITGITLAVGVATWIFSPLKFQADMGILLTFMFLLNMLGAIFLLPALAHFMIKPKRVKTKKLN